MPSARDDAATRSKHRHVYELTGGHPCLDFANTLESRPTDHPEEHLSSFEDVVEWGVQSGTLAGPIAESLRHAAERDPDRADHMLDEARRLREVLFGVFSAVARGDRPPPAALDRLNRWIPTAMSRLEIAADSGAFVWRWKQDGRLDRPLWPVVRSAGELLTSSKLDRVRECGADDCAWLFLDLSRNRSRRWCDMKVCGNRFKVRRFRAAQRG